MRIISQDGTQDVPYNETRVFVKEVVIDASHYEYNIHAYNNAEMGSYLSKEKALEVMKRIREQSEKESICYEHKFIEHTNEFVIDYTYVANGFFYMPQDKEVVIDNG